MHNLRWNNWNAVCSARLVLMVGATAARRRRMPRFHNRSAAFVNPPISTVLNLPDGLVAIRAVSPSRIALETAGGAPVRAAKWLLWQRVLAS
jgi:hypothetical protein